MKASADLAYSLNSRAMSQKSCGISLSLAILLSYTLKWICETAIVKPFGSIFDQTDVRMAVGDADPEIGGTQAFSLDAMNDLKGFVGLTNLNRQERDGIIKFNGLGRRRRGSLCAGNRGYVSARIGDRTGDGSGALGSYRAAPMVSAGRNRDIEHQGNAGVRFDIANVGIFLGQLFTDGFYGGIAEALLDVAELIFPDNSERRRARSFGVSFRFSLAG